MKNTAKSNFSQLYIYIGKKPNTMKTIFTIREKKKSQTQTNKNNQTHTQKGEIKNKKIKKRGHKTPPFINTHTKKPLTNFYSLFLITHIYNTQSFKPNKPTKSKMSDLSTQFLTYLDPHLALRLIDFVKEKNVTNNHTHTHIPPKTITHLFS